MKYIELNNENRIISCIESEFPQKGIAVQELPKGSIFDYVFYNGKFELSPLSSNKKEPELQPQSSLEERISDCELMLADIIGGAI